MTLTHYEDVLVKILMVVGAERTHSQNFQQWDELAAWRWAELGGEPKAPALPHGHSAAAVAPNIMSHRDTPNRREGGAHRRALSL